LFRPELIRNGTTRTLGQSLSFLDNTQALQTLDSLINVKIAIVYPKKLILISEDKFRRVNIREGADRRKVSVFTKISV